MARKKTKNPGGGGGGGGGGGRRRLDVFERAIKAHLTRWSISDVVTDNDDGSAEVITSLDKLPADFFNPSLDELAFPITLDAGERRLVHRCAMALGLEHGSAGTEEDRDRHVVVSKTGAFDGEEITSTDTARRRAAANGQGCGQTWIAERDVPEGGVASVAVLLSGNTTKELVAAVRELCQRPDYRLGEFQRGDLSDWPRVGDETVSFLLVDTPVALDAMIATLQHVDCFGFDLELNMARSYFPRTCLLQVSTERCDFVVDPLAPGMWAVMSRLRGGFADRDKLKIGHAIGSCDVKGLFCDFGIIVVNAFDTYEAALALGWTRTLSLAKLLVKFGAVDEDAIADLKGRYQCCDWRERNLSDGQLRYARGDTRFLVPLYRLLKSELRQADGGATAGGGGGGGGGNDTSPLLRRVLSGDKKNQADQQGQGFDDRLAFRDLFGIDADQNPDGDDDGDQSSDDGLWFAKIDSSELTVDERGTQGFDGEEGGANDNVVDDDDDDDWWPEIEASAGSLIGTKADCDHDQLPTTITDNDPMALPRPPDQEDPSSSPGRLTSVSARHETLHSVLVRSNKQCVKLRYPLPKLKTISRDRHTRDIVREKMRGRRKERWTESDALKFRCVYEKLWHWRDGIGRERDECCHYVCPGNRLADIALMCPTSALELRRIARPLPEIIEAGLYLPSGSPPLCGNGNSPAASASASAVQWTSACPCCRARSLTSRGAGEICAQCGWIDDDRTLHFDISISHPSSLRRRSHASGRMKSLAEARADFRVVALLLDAVTAGLAVASTPNNSSPPTTEHSSSRRRRAIRWGAYLAFGVVGTK